MCRKPSTAKGRRLAKNKEPKLKENPKTAVFVRGPNTSELGAMVLQSMSMLRSRYSKYFGRPKKVRPFEDVAPLEKILERYDSSLFAVSMKSKRRGDTIVLGRAFNGSVLDMCELVVCDYAPPMTQMDLQPDDGTNDDTDESDDGDDEAAEGRAAAKWVKKQEEHEAKVAAQAAAAGKSLIDASGAPALGSKPMMVFYGRAFDTEGGGAYGRLRNLLLDMFSGYEAGMVDIRGLDHVISVCALDETAATAGGGPDHAADILIRVYSVKLLVPKSSSRSGGVPQRAPRVELRLMGPVFNLRVGRTQWGEHESFKIACTHPSALRGAAMRETLAASLGKAKTKNVSHDRLDGKLGRVHVGRQDYKALANSVKRTKALKQKKR